MREVIFRLFQQKVVILQQFFLSSFKILKCLDFENFWPSFGQIFWKVPKLQYIISNITFALLHEFKQNRYVRRCTFDVLVFCTGLKWRVPPGVAMGVKRDLLFFVGVFGGYLPSISHIKLKFKWGKRSTINFYFISIG